jgi:hypothetical protein
MSVPMAAALTGFCCPAANPIAIAVSSPAAVFPFILSFISKTQQNNVGLNWLAAPVAGRRKLYNCCLREYYTMDFLFADDEGICTLPAAAGIITYLLLCGSALGACSGTLDATEGQIILI